MRFPRDFSSPGWTVPALSLSSSVRCSNPLMIFVVQCGTHSSKSVPSFYWGAQNWTQHTDVALSVLRRREGAPPLTYLQHSSLCSPGCCLPSLPEGPIAGSCSSWCSPHPQVLSCKAALQPVSHSLFHGSKTVIHRRYITWVYNMNI